jgi:hypothetical protein
MKEKLPVVPQTRYSSFCVNTSDTEVRIRIFVTMKTIVSLAGFEVLTTVVMRRSTVLGYNSV